MVAMEVNLRRGFDGLPLAAPVETPQKDAPTTTPQPTRREPFTPPNPDHDEARPSFDPNKERKRCSDSNN
jgi:hypothetical protein